MSIRQEGSQGREKQRNRTRRALVDAAMRLLREGITPTVGEAAEAAEVSRATAYRYFPTQAMLLAEVVLFDVGGPLVQESDRTELPLPEAVGRLVRRVGEWAYDSEQPLRTLLRLSLDPASRVRRPGHRVEWIADVLAPARDRLDDATYERLVSSLTLLMGIDPVVVMTDIAGLPRDKALDALEWSARSLVEAALRETS